MVSKVIMTRGLPASGKSSWAQKQVKSNSDVTRVNKDDLREMMHNSQWSRGREKEVLKARDHLVMEALSLGKTVIVDDTNFAPQHEARLREIAKSYGAKFEIKDFDVPLSEALERNAKRTDKTPVPESVIYDMWDRYLKPEIVYDESLPKAVIVDIDGTLAHMEGRSPYDWSRVREDSVDEMVRIASNGFYSNGFRVLVLSGRDGECYEDTVQWLLQNDIKHHALYMRAAGDSRKDSIVKRELFETYIQPFYYPALVIDDRRQVVDMWRHELGLTCWQVAPGRF